jgi:hypothetical protein
MPANQYNFSVLNTKKALARIRSAQGDVRVAFALGEFDAAVPVVEVLRGKPTTAVTRLKAASFETGEKPLGVNIKSIEKKRTRAINWGLLSFDPQTHTLNVECEKKGSKKQARNFRKFFRSLKGTPFWTTVNFAELAPNADGIADENEADEANAALFPMQDVDPKIAAVEEDQIKGDWIDDEADTAADASTPPAYSPGDPPPAYSPGDAPPAYTPRDAPPAYTPGDAPPAYTPGDAPPAYTAGEVPPAYTPGEAPPAYTPEAQAGETILQPEKPTSARDPAAIAADAERLNNFVMKMVDSLPVGKDGTPEELKDLLTNLLQHMSPEHLLLALMRSANRDVLREMGKVEPKPASTAGSVDIAEVTDALLAMATNLAQQRRILLSNEIPKSIVIREQVRLQWTRAQALAEKERGENASLDVTGLVQRMAELFNVGRMDDRALRGFIGLNRSPLIDPNVSVDGQTPLAGIPAVLKLWQDVQVDVLSQVNQIKSKVAEALAALEDPNGLKTVEDFNGTWKHVDAAVAAFKPEQMMANIRLLAASASDPNVHERRKAEIETLVNEIAAAAAMTLVENLDDNPLGVEGRIRAVVRRSIEETQRLLQNPREGAEAA